MKIREKIKKIIQEKMLSKEMKRAKSEISERFRKINTENNLKNSENRREEFKKNLDEKLEKLSVTKKKFNLEKLKDFGLVTVAIMLVGIGFVNFSKDKEGLKEMTVETSSNSISSNTLGDIELVNANAAIVENDKEVKNVVLENSNEATKNSIKTNEVSNENSQNSITTGASSTNFKQLKLDRDNIYSQKLDAYQKMIDSSKISSEQKGVAIKEVEKITNTQNSISIAEELIKLKGFEDAIIYVNDNSISVIVRAATLSTEDTAKIQNIITKQFDVEIRKYKYF